LGVAASGRKLRGDQKGTRKLTGTKMSSQREEGMYNYVRRRGPFGNRIIIYQLYFMKKSRVVETSNTKKQEEESHPLGGMLDRKFSEKSFKQRQGRVRKGRRVQRGGNKSIEGQTAVENRKRGKREGRGVPGVGVTKRERHGQFGAIVVRYCGEGSEN